MTRWIAVSVVAIAAAGLLYAQQGRPAGTWPGVDPRPPNEPAQKPAVAGQTRAPEQRLDVQFDVVTVAEGLQNPWGLAFLPDGRMLDHGAAGAAAGASAPTAAKSEPVTGLPAVDARGQGGLLDVTLDPKFADEQARLLELRRAARRRRQQHRRGPRHARRRRRAAARGRAGDLPPGAVARLARCTSAAAWCWHRDGTLFVTHGRSLDHRGPDAGAADGRPARQDRPHQRRRLDPGGQPVRRQGRRAPRAMWSLGHRNIQSAALHPATGELWEVEHGTRGGDELNIARKGKDYGWPTIAYGIEYRRRPDHRRDHSSRPGMEQPLYYWDPDHRAERHGVLHRRRLPGVEGQPLRRRPRHATTWSGSRSTARR